MTILVVLVVAIVVIVVLRGSARPRQPGDPGAFARCPSCGTEHPTFAKFCRQCGTKIRS